MSYLDKVREWEKQDKPVRGHLCDGLKVLQATDRYCEPSFDMDGKIEGCDDSNDTPILFCPMCGVKL